MTDQYRHALASDQRWRAAMSTADKVGSAYAGWAPRARRSSWPLVGLALVAVMLAVHLLA